MEQVNDLRITLIQPNLYWESPEENREHISEMMNSISGNTDLIVLPEMFTTGFTMSASALAEPMKGKTMEWMKAKAAELNAAVCGSVIIEDEGGRYNRLLFVQPDGSYTSYDKRHLFFIEGEIGVFEPGKERVIVNFRGWRIALYICYDVRFPVWSRNRKDTDLALYVANWPASRTQVWQTLLKARAIENQIYVAGVNRIGSDGNEIDYCGDSLVVNPRGEVMSRLENREEVVTETLSMERLENFRVKFPVGNDADDFRLL
ncbi:hydrolase YafV [Prolixibacter bellariivorans]|uniref:Omega-amidase YafV n=1 Tax=Prolixibacter bellariivorans TaxID=314319 RepID=A0A5M4B4Q7_9BACT|nr:amidohydrolase [Prolixibacter bellariivorans]GET35114.1 hydrolase YafV [Prolixibacter bellariivorans]